MFAADRGRAEDKAFGRRGQRKTVCFASAVKEVDDFVAGRGPAGGTLHTEQQLDFNRGYIDRIQGDNRRRVLDDPRAGFQDGPHDLLDEVWRRGGNAYGQRDLMCFVGSAEIGDTLSC